MSHNVLLRLPAFLFLLFITCLGAFAAVEEQPTSSTQKRLAIVVGNSHYKSGRLEQLPNAANDAARLSESLRRLNFDVLEGSDLTS